MADKSINQLPVSDGLTDDGLLVVYQNGVTQSIVGNLIKQFAQQGIESALAAAKASGEFDGKDGYTPVKGVDYFDGEDGEDAVSPTVAVINITGGHRITITDKNGTKTVDVLDGVDGQDGEDGSDGVSPTIAVEAITGGHRLTITDATGTKTVNVMDGEDGANGVGSGDMLAKTYDPQGKKQDVFAYVDNAVKNAVSTDDIDAAVSEALEEAKASGEFDGADGQDGADGVSCTHSWNGTTLTVTSASGTSSANLKGEKGDTGSTGADGYTPVRGTDYWTDADKAQMVNDVIAALPDASEVSY